MWRIKPSFFGYNKDMKKNKALILKSGCGAILDIIEDRNDLTKRNLRITPRYCGWISANIVEIAEGCRLIKIGEDAS